jgi:hypothetical protein
VKFTAPVYGHTSLYFYAIHAYSQMGKESFAEQVAKWNCACGKPKLEFKRRDRDGKAYRDHCRGCYNARRRQLKAIADEAVHTPVPKVSLVRRKRKTVPTKKLCSCGTPVAQYGTRPGCVAERGHCTACHNKQRRKNRREKAAAAKASESGGSDTEGESEGSDAEVDSEATESEEWGSEVESAEEPQEPTSDGTYFDTVEAARNDAKYSEHRFLSRGGGRAYGCAVRGCPVIRRVKSTPGKGHQVKETGDHNHVHVATGVYNSSSAVSHEVLTNSAWFQTPKVLQATVAPHLQCEMLRNIKKKVSRKLRKQTLRAFSANPHAQNVLEGKVIGYRALSKGGEICVVAHDNLLKQAFSPNLKIHAIDGHQRHMQPGTILLCIVGQDTTHSVYPLAWAVANTNEVKETVQAFVEITDDYCQETFGKGLDAPKWMVDGGGELRKGIDAWFAPVQAKAASSQGKSTFRQCRVGDTMDAEVLFGMCWRHVAAAVREHANLLPRGSSIEQAVRELFLVAPYGDKWRDVWTTISAAWTGLGWDKMVGYVTNAWIKQNNGWWHGCVFGRVSVAELLPRYYEAM